MRESRDEVFFFPKTPTYPLGNDHISHRLREVRNISDSKMPAGMGYVIVPRRVSIDRNRWLSQ